MSAFIALTRESIRDGIRRRVVPAIVGVSLLSLVGINSCTTCAAQITINGQTTPAAPGWTALVLVVALGLWTVVMAGLLAADHIAASLEDGSAQLVLARPVSRLTFVGARLGGVLAVTLATGAVMITVAVTLLNQRMGISIAPAAVAALAVGAGAVTSGALSMALSLTLPRIACVLVVLAAVPTLAVANLISLLGGEPGGLTGFLDRFGPPVAGGMLLALAPWYTEAPAEGGVQVALRLVLWTVGSIGLLVALFRRAEL